MDRRIYGLETEYGVACTSGGTRRLTPDEVARYLFRRVVTWGRSSNVFLRNGSRIYLDVGSHPEYATAECDDLVQLINHDRAGERSLVKITLHEGRNHVVRRTMEAVGHPVRRLSRTGIGPVRLGTLKTGEFRELTRDELGGLLDLTGG